MVNAKQAKLNLRYESLKEFLRVCSEICSNHPDSNATKRLVWYRTAVDKMYKNNAQQAIKAHYDLLRVFLEEVHEHILTHDNENDDWLANGNRRLAFKNNDKIVIELSTIYGFAKEDSDMTSDAFLYHLFDVLSLVDRLDDIDPSLEDTLDRLSTEYTPVDDDDITGDTPATGNHVESLMDGADQIFREFTKPETMNRLQTMFTGIISNPQVMSIIANLQPPTGPAPAPAPAQAQQLVPLMDQDEDED